MIRPLGAPIKGFGGVASGPAPLIQLHTQIDKVIGGRAGETLDSRAITDIINLIGTCVVSGNVRRSATLALGAAEDEGFINGEWKKGETTARNEKRFVTEMQQGSINYKKDGLNNILNVLNIENIDISLYTNTKFINVTMK